VRCCSYTLHIQSKSHVLKATFSVRNPFQIINFRACCGPEVLYLINSGRFGKCVYGLVTVIDVPLLSPSGSWLEVGEYITPEPDKLLTVKVTLVFLEFILAEVTLHWPLTLVVQVAVPVVPPLQAPVTVMPATGAWLASCTIIVTVAFQFFLTVVLIPSRSPTWMGTTGAFKTVALTELLPVCPMVSVAVAETV